MSDIHALSGAYAVDALDDVERAHFERHLAECDECRAEVTSFRETAALLSEAEAETPPPSLRDGVLSGIAQIRPLPPEVVVRRPASGRRARRLPELLAAAAAVVLLAMGAMLWHPWQHHTSLADQVLNAPDAVRVTESLPGGQGRLILVRSRSLGRAVMLADHVPPPPAGKTYELWLQPKGQTAMVPAGLMTDPSKATLLMGDPSTAMAAAVSVERGSGASHPSKDVVAVFPLKPDAGGHGSA